MFASPIFPMENIILYMDLTILTVKIKSTEVAPKVKKFVLPLILLIKKFLPKNTEKIYTEKKVIACYNAIYKIRPFFIKRLKFAYIR
jgi:hypothetical protein